MKFIKFLVVTAIVIGGGLFGAKFYAEKNSGELASVLDQLNPLVKEGNVYVKTKKANSVNGYGIASYTQVAADEEGKTREITFTADHELKTDHYLKVPNKGAHINTYEEVNQDQVPEKALQAIQK